eukprot:15366366-Ditylum_brightwellii.AAC.1
MTRMVTIQPQGAQRHEALSNDITCDFVDMVKPKKNGQSRMSTEYHAMKFISCFEKRTCELNSNNLRNEEDSEDVDSEEE